MPINLLGGAMGNAGNAGDASGFRIPGWGLGAWGAQPMGGQRGAPTRGQAIGGMLMGAAQGLGQGGTVAGGIMGAAQGMAQQRQQAKAQQDEELWAALQRLIRERGMPGAAPGPMATATPPFAPPPGGGIY